MSFSVEAAGNRRDESPLQFPTYANLCDVMENPLHENSMCNFLCIRNQRDFQGYNLLQEA